MDPIRIVTKETFEPKDWKDSKLKMVDILFLIVTFHFLDRGSLTGHLESILL